MNEAKRLEKQKRSRTRHEFLLTLLDGQKERAINGFYLVAQNDESGKPFQVAIFTAETYKKMAKYKQENLL